MRERLRRFMIDNLEEVREAPGGIPDYTASRVKEPHGLTALKKRPFVVIIEGPLDPGEAWAGIATAVEVWPHVEHEKFTDLDPFANKILALLDEKILEPRSDVADGSARYMFESLATGGDQHVPEWETITRALRFSVFDLSFLSSETFEPDPVAALAKWTQDTFGADVQADRDSWKPSTGKPGIYWRTNGISRVIEQFPTWSLVEARVHGHVIAPDYATRLEWTRRVHQAALLKRKIKLGDDSPMTILPNSGADSTAHPIRTGQITLVVQFGILIPQEESPILEHVHVSGAVPTQEVM